MKKIILLIFILLWMFLIFLLSNEPAVKSEVSSNKVIDIVIFIKEKLVSKKLTVEEKQIIYKKLEFPIRKSAHFTIYLILGVLVYLFVVEFNINKKIIISLLICVIYSFSDEIHQAFIEGRSGEFRDVLIDTFGSYAGILLIKKLKELKK